MLNAIFERYDIFIFILMRMTGFVLFNPVFGRRNIPVMTRGALAFVLALTALMAVTSDPEIDAMQTADISNMMTFFILLIKEFIFGYLMGLIVNLFFGVVVVGGEIMDLQIGLAMSQLFDPASNVQMPLMGNFLNFAFMLMFFLTNSHITLTGILFLSFGISPVGIMNFNADIGIYLMQIFMEIFVLSVRLAFPILAAELIMEVGVGLLMRAVPQINIFVVGLQLKILAGISVMLICAPISVWFFDGVFARMNERVFEALRVLAR
jgi:flagellar biosynthetic protein FliR